MRYDNDALFAELTDVVNNEVNPRTGKTFRGWYMRAFYALGKDEVIKLASIARAEGRDKKRYFSRLLKGALAKKPTQN